MPRREKVTAWKLLRMNEIFVSVTIRNFDIGCGAYFESGNGTNSSGRQGMQPVGKHDLDASNDL